MYARITRFDAPEEAEPNTVSVSVSVLNEEPQHVDVLLQIWDEAGKAVFHEERRVTSGSTETFTATLTMPDRDYTLRALTWYWPWWLPSPDWTYQDEASKTIKKAVAPPPTPPTPPTPPPAPWWEQTFLGVPVWGWLAGVAVTVTIIGVAAYMREREEELMMLMLMRS